MKRPAIKIKTFLDKFSIPIGTIINLFWFLLFLGVFNRGVKIIIPYLAVLGYTLLPGKRDRFLQFMGSSFIGLTWVIIARGQYNYGSEFIHLFSIPLFPAVCFSVGLFLTYQVYRHYSPLLKKRGFISRIILCTIIYWILLISLETIGYYLFEIRNLAHASHKGLPIVKSLHAPLWMQIFYFAAGPLHYTICHFLKVEK